MRRAVALASVAGIGAVGGLLGPLAVPPGTALPGGIGTTTAAAPTVAGSLGPAAPTVSGSLGPVPAALPPVVAAQPRLLFAGARFDSAASPPDPLDLWEVVAADGSQQRIAATDAADPALAESAPSYAPDGRRAVITVGGPEGGHRLAVVDLAAGDATAATELLAYDWQVGTWDAAPDWSHDGERVVFTRRGADPSGELTRLRVVELEDGGVSDPFARLDAEDLARFEGRDILAPTWSPDGSRLLFVSAGDGDVGDLWLLDLEEAVVHPVVRSNGSAALAQAAEWSPDGTQIAFVDGSSSLGLTVLAGEVGQTTGSGTDRRVPLNDRVVYRAIVDEFWFGLFTMRDPAWSPDGAHITVRAYETWGTSSRVEGLYAIDVDTGSYAALVDDTSVTWTYLEHPAYQPWSDLRVDLAVPETATAGERVDLTATVTNSGPSPAWGTVVALELPGATDGWEFDVVAPPGCVGDGGYLECTLPEPIEVGEDGAVELTVEVVLTQPGEFAAQASVTAHTPDPEADDNLASGELAVAFPAAVGTEPRLAFTYWNELSGRSSYQADIADVHAPDGSDFRLLVDEVIDPQGAALRPREQQPSYSPDGRRIVFSSQQHELGSNGSGPWLEWNHQLMVADVGPAGAGPAEPLNYPREEWDHDTSPVWSPDGTRIAYLHGEGDSYPAVAVVDVVDPGAPLPERRLIEPEEWTEGQWIDGLTWSPDAKRLVLSISEGDSGYLWIVDVDSGAVHPLITSCGFEWCDLTGSDPAWSPDGRRIAFESPYTTAGGVTGTGIGVVEVGERVQGPYYLPAPVLIPGLDPESTEAEPSDADPLDDQSFEDPTWADAGHITFVSTRGGDGVLLTVPATGGAATVLRETAPGRYFHFGDPVYQPRADLGVQLRAETPTVAGMPFRLRATVTNHGPAPAADSRVSITVPAIEAGEAILETVPSGCEQSGARLDCLLDGALPVDTPTQIDLTLQVPEPGDHVASAAVATGSVDLRQDNDTAATTIRVRDLPAGGLEPRLAFTRQADGSPVDRTPDVADVPAAGGPHDLARLLAHQTVDGQPLEESHPDYSPDGTTLVFSATPPQGDALGVPRLALGTLVPGEVPGDEPALVDLRFLDYDHLDWASDTEPAWSPDGRTIAFTRDDHEGYWSRRVALVDVASGDVRVLGHPDLDGFEAMSAAWSPDGERLAVQVTRSGEMNEVWVVHLDAAGDEWFPVGNPLPGCIGDPEDCFLPAQGVAPAWSPDGSRIAVGDGFLDDGEPWGRSAIVAHTIPEAPTADHYPVTGSQVLAGTPAYDDDPVTGPLEAAWHPAWSPDGTELTFVGRASQDAQPALYTVPATGGDAAPRVVEWDADRPGRYADPAYQPWSDVSLTWEGPDSAALAGDAIRATAVVTNRGPSAAWGVTTTLTLPSAVDLLSWDAGCALLGSVLTCLEPGPVQEEHRIELVFRSQRPGSHEVSGEVTTTTLDPDLTDNAAHVLLVVEARVPAEGIEPRLAFTYSPDRPGEEPLADVADVFGADGSDFRVVAEEWVPDPEGGGHEAQESHPSYSPDGRRMVYSAARTLDSYSDGEPPYWLGWNHGLMVGDTRPGPIGLVDVAPLDYDRPAGAHDVEPAWAPDGRQIAFVRHLDNSARLALADVATGAVRYVEVGDELTWVSAPTWAPEGDRLVVEVNSDGGGQLWVIHLDEAGDQAYPIVVEPQVCENPDGPCTWDLWGSDPAWSPDGTRLAYVDRYWTVEDYVSGLLTVELPEAPVAGAYRVAPPLLVAGSDADRTEPLSPEDVRDLLSPAWALDSSALAVVGYTGEAGASAVIYTVDADGGALQVLRAEVREGLRHDFADLDYQPWADVGVEVTASAPQVDVAAPVDITVRVTNHGPSPAWGVQSAISLGTAPRVSNLPAGCVTADALLSCTGPEALAVGDSLEYVFTLEPDAAGDQTATAQVSARTIDTVADNDEDAVTFSAVDPPPDPGPGPGPGPVPDPVTDLAVTLDLERDTGWVGGDPVTATFVVTNRGPDRAEGVTVTLTYLPEVTPQSDLACAVVGECVLGSLAPGASRTITVGLAPVEEGAGQVTATVRATTPDPRRGNDTTAGDLEILQPRLRLLPAVVVPGEATLAYGVDFPPGAELDLRWDHGITPWARPVTVAEDGTVRSPMLVLSGDEIGQRLLLATSVAGLAFGEVETPPLLVVPRTMAPPDYLYRGR